MIFSFLCIFLIVSEIWRPHNGEDKAKSLYYFTIYFTENTDFKEMKIKPRQTIQICIMLHFNTRTTVPMSHPSTDVWPQFEAAPQQAL